MFYSLFSAAMTEDTRTEKTKVIIMLPMIPLTGRQVKETIQAMTGRFCSGVTFSVATWQRSEAVASSLGCDWRPHGNQPGVPDKWGVVGHWATCQCTTGDSWEFVFQGSLSLRVIHSVDLCICETAFCVLACLDSSIFSTTPSSESHSLLMRGGLS